MQINGIRYWLAVLGLMLSITALAPAAYSDSLARDVNKAFRKIGVGPEQSEAYSKLYEDYLRSRNQAVRRVLNNTSGDAVPVMAKKKVRRVAKKSIKQMRAVLDEHQLEYYERYLALANKLFLRESGLR